MPADGRVLNVNIELIQHKNSGTDSPRNKTFRRDLKVRVESTGDLVGGKNGH